MRAEELDAMRAEHQYPSYATAGDEVHQQNPECSCGRNPCVVPALLDEITRLQIKLDTKRQELSNADAVHQQTLREWANDRAETKRLDRHFAGGGDS